MTWSSRPSSRIKASASGFAERKLSGPHSSTQSSHWRVSMTPPTRGCLSRRTCSMPDLERSYAADKPAIPPPTMTAFAGTGRLQLELADDLDAGLHVLDRRLW